VVAAQHLVGNLGRFDAASGLKVTKIYPYVGWFGGGWSVPLEV
jgi:hypothetical protein